MKNFMSLLMKMTDKKSLRLHTFVLKNVKKHPPTVLWFLEIEQMVFWF